MNWKGERYEEFNHLGIVDVAKLIRADLKAAVSDGKLPKGIKVSVRCEHGTSIYVTVKSCAGLGAILNPERVLWERDNPHSPPPTLTTLPRYTNKAQTVLDTLEALTNAYNYDNSEIQTDYFDRGFYEHVGFGYDLEKADREETWRLYDAAKASGHLEAAKAVEQLFRQAYLNRNRVETETPELTKYDGRYNGIIGDARGAIDKLKGAVSSLKSLGPYHLVDAADLLRLAIDDAELARRKVLRLQAEKDEVRS